MRFSRHSLHLGARRRDSFPAEAPMTSFTLALSTRFVSGIFRFLAVLHVGSLTIAARRHVLDGEMGNKCQTPDGDALVCSVIPNCTNGALIHLRTADLGGFT